MDSVGKIKGSDIWELFKLQNKFFEEIHSIIEILDGNLDKKGFELFKTNLLDVGRVNNQYDYWAPTGIQFSFKNKNNMISINFIFREMDIEEINRYACEPLILISKYELSQTKNSDEYDNYDIVKELIKTKRFGLNTKIDLKNLFFKGNIISNGFFKAIKLLDMTSKKDIIDVCDEINTW